MANRIITRIALCSLVILSACGGGGSDTQAPPAQADACKPITVALIGDSTQWGSDGSAHNKAPNNPGAALQASMDRRFGVGAVLVLDRAVGGTTVLQAPSVAADIVVANYGINDAAPWGESLADYRAALMALQVTLFETPNPTPGQAWDIAARAQTMREVAALRGIPVADVFTYVSGLPNFEAYLPVDGIHPSNELYGLISANVLAPAVALQVIAHGCVH